MIDFIQNNFPNVENYNEFKSLALTVKETYIDCAQQLKSFLAQKEIVENKEEIYQSIDKLRIAINILKESRKVIITKLLTGVENKLNKKVDTIKSSLPGQFRTTLTFEVINKHEVPAEFLCVDEDKVKKFLKDYGKELKEKFKDNLEEKQPIAGIKIFIKKGFTNA